MSLFKQLQMQKSAGEKLEFNELTKDELKRLSQHDDMSDQSIADLYDVTKGRVTYKRRKFGITFRNKLYDELKSNPAKLFDTLNTHCKKMLIKKQGLDQISKALTKFAFRDTELIENIHCRGGLTQEDMKNINKLLVNRFGYLAYLVICGKWFELYYLVADYSMSTSNWDSCDPDDDGNAQRALNNLEKTLRRCP
jgi:hypothetical protein